MTVLLNFLGEILGAILTGVFNGLLHIIDLIGKKDHDLKADFGSIKKVKSYSKESSLYIGSLAVDEKTALNSTLIIGRTGSGKTSKVYSNSLLQSPKPKSDNSCTMSYVVLDPKGEIQQDTGAYNQRKGYEVDCINFSEAEKSTVTWNPLEGLDESEISRFCSEFIETAMRSSQTNDPFWGISAQRILEFSVLLLRLFGSTYCNLYNARYIVERLSGERKELNLLMSLEIIPDALFTSYEAIIHMGDKLLASVLATTLASLSLFKDPNIAKITSSSTLDMKSYRESSKILFIQTPVMNQAYVSVLNSLLFSRFFSYCMSELPKKQDNTVGFFIDECSSLKMKPSLIPLACSMLRGYKAFGVFGYQSLSQMNELMGKSNARTVVQNVGTSLFFPRQDLQASSEISNLLGKYTYTDDNGVKHVRDLMTTDEISFLQQKDGGILFSGTERGILIPYIKPFFKNRKLLKRSLMKSEPQQKLSLSIPSLLPITEIIKTSKS